MKKYYFSDLSKKVQQRLIEDNKGWIIEDFQGECNDDWEETMNKFGELTRSEISEWGVDACQYHFKLTCDSQLEELNGDELYRYIYTLFHDKMECQNEYGKYVQFAEFKQYDECITYHLVCFLNHENVKSNYKELLELCYSYFFTKWMEEIAYHTSDEGIREWFYEGMDTSTYDKDGNYID